MSAVESAGQLLAEVFGDPMTADNVGGHFTCAEANNVAEALIGLGRPGDAVTWLIGHSHGDDDQYDSHAWDPSDAEDRAEEYVRDVLR